MDTRRALGAAGEELTARWYVDAGYAVVDRNWRCREGELDLVLFGHGGLVFCEVKTRRSATFGAPFEAVTVVKQRRLRALAMLWLRDHPAHRAEFLRFDVASVVVRDGAPPTIDVIEAAF